MSPEENDKFLQNKATFTDDIFNSIKTDKSKPKRTPNMYFVDYFLKHLECLIELINNCKFILMLKFNYANPALTSFGFNSCNGDEYSASNGLSKVMAIHLINNPISN